MIISINYKFEEFKKEQSPFYSKMNIPDNSKTFHFIPLLEFSGILFHSQNNHVFFGFFHVFGNGLFQKCVRYNFIIFHVIHIW